MRTMTLVLAWTMLAKTVFGAKHCVGAQGDDANAGTKAQPWRTPGKACATVRPGDTVRLGAGACRETLRPKLSGGAGKPIRFAAPPGGKVVPSGGGPLAGTWRPYQGGICRLAKRPGFAQLSVDGKTMLEARWPNSPVTDPMDMRRARAGEGTGYGALADPKLPAGDWNGAVAIFRPGGEWVDWARRVTECQPGKSFRSDVATEAKARDKYRKEDPCKPRAGNPYPPVGALAGLDGPGEWFLDGATCTVRLWAVDGKSPAGRRAGVGQRLPAVDPGKPAFIGVKGVDIGGAAVGMAGGEDCVPEDCRLRHAGHIQECPDGKTPPVPNVIAGKRNAWRKCPIAYGAASAPTMSGEDNALPGRVVRDANCLGGGRGGLDPGRPVGARVEHCTIFRAGRDTVRHGGSKRIGLQYNDLYDGNMLNNDAGAIYCRGTGGEGGVIAYNWIHDNPHCNGIYLDNFSSNFVVHHNVVWACGGNAFHINSDALHHLIYNNTISQTGNAFGTYCYPAYTPTMKGTRIVNNLVNELMHPKDPREFVQGELGPELAHNGPGAVDQDGYPTKGSAAINAGVVIEGITDGFLGKAPDLGAYEFGGPRWVAGADWRDPDAPQAPARNLTYAPCGPITAKTMITDGLALWFDATDKASLKLDPDGTVLAWHDKSPHQRVALPVQADGSVKWVADGMNGQAVLRGNGTGGLRVADLKREPGAMTVFVVSQALEACGPSWQRIMANYTGVGQEWVAPNWMIGAPGGAESATWDAQVFTVQKRHGAALGTITVLGASASQGQALGGDVGEVLLFDRSLRFDEMEAVQKYLAAKWGIVD